jgi:N-methylhydantoinase A/oxoprolinase/acetone carboxylase beta subunit
VKPRAAPRSAFAGTTRACFSGVDVQARLVERAELSPGEHFSGPAIVREFSGTTLVPPGCRASVTAGGHLRLER